MAITEKIFVDGFAGLRELEIELSRINVLIGPQAAGKSVVAKLLYFFKSFTSTLADSVAAARAWPELETTLASRFRSFFPTRSQGPMAAIIRFDAGDRYIEIQPGSESIALSCSPIFRDVYDECIRNLEPHSPLGEGPLGDRAAAKKIFLFHVGGTSGVAQRFIPASRSFFAHLKGNVFTYLDLGSENLAIDPFIIQFGRFYEQIRSSLLDIQEAGDKNVLGLTDRILGGRYVSLEGDEYLRHPDGRQIHVADASSGQQEALPLAIVVTHLLRARSESTTYIEEPEAHLFPSAQRDVVDLLATAFNRSKADLQFFLTTHSPYILTSLNNLLEAGQLYRTLEGDKLEQLRKIVPEERAIPPSSVAAYALEGGRARSIFDDEYGLIAGEEIDSVSDDLALELDKLLDLEPEKV